MQNANPYSVTQDTTCPESCVTASSRTVRVETVSVTWL